MGPGRGRRVGTVEVGVRGVWVGGGRSGGGGKWGGGGEGWGTPGEAQAGKSPCKWSAQTLRVCGATKKSVNRDMQSFIGNQSP